MEWEFELLDFGFFSMLAGASQEPTNALMETGVTVSSKNFLQLGSTNGGKILYETAQGVGVIDEVCSIGGNEPDELDCGLLSLPAEILPWHWLNLVGTLLGSRRRLALQRAEPQRCRKSQEVRIRFKACIGQSLR
jgi:hypothetical protein